MEDFNPDKDDLQKLFNILEENYPDKAGAVLNTFNARAIKTTLNTELPEEDRQPMGNIIKWRLQQYDLLS